MRARFDRAYIEGELQRLGDSMEPSLTVYLIGGGAMAFRDLKDTTKDIDLIVTNGENLKQLQTTLLSSDYEIVKNPGEEYDELGAQRIFENDDNCRIDVFNQQVIDKLVFSDGMRKRSERYLEAGGLSVELVSSEDIFLFKAVAGRTDDIEDMFALVQTDLNFDVIEEELKRQIDLLGQELFVSYINEALFDLEKQYNITTPLGEIVSDITERVYRELEVLQAIGDSIHRSELEPALDLSSEKIDEILQSLERKDVIAIDAQQITRETAIL